MSSEIKLNGVEEGGRGRQEVSETRKRLETHLHFAFCLSLPPSFDFCAQCVKSFIKEHFGIDENSEDKKDLVLGFTVSCALRQTRSASRLPRFRVSFADPRLRIGTNSSYQFSYPCA